MVEETITAESYMQYLTALKKSTKFFSELQESSPVSNSLSVDSYDRDQYVFRYVMNLPSADGEATIMAAIFCEREERRFRIAVESESKDKKLLENILTAAMARIEKS